MSATHPPTLPLTRAPKPGQPTDAGRGTALRQRLGDLILGQDPRLRLPTGMCFLAACLYMTWFAVIYFVGMPTGLIPPWLGHMLMTQSVVATLSFYPLIRSGLTRHWSDPAIAMPQMLWTSAAVILGYATVEATRPVALQTLCLIQVFGFLSLKPRGARWMGGITITMLLTMLITMASHPSSQFDVRIEVLKIGAACFIISLLAWQSGRFARLRQRVSAEKRELRGALTEIKRITSHDALTGLPNRQLMQERIEAERERAARTGSHFSVALLDLDHFKLVNDTHGHQIGDEVLIRFAEVARKALRETDLIGRWGGEEFVVLMLDTDPAPLGLIGLERVRTMLAATQVSREVPPLRVRFSAGITCSSINETLEQLVGRSDKALYEAKAKGRNQTCIGD